MRRYQPDPAELHACIPVPFDADAYWEGDEENRTETATARAKAWHDKREAERVAGAVYRCEQIRKHGVPALARVWHTTNRG